MKSKFIFYIIIIITLLPLSAQNHNISEADRMYSEDLYDDGINILLSAIPAATDVELVEIYWRLSMFIMSLTDEMEDKKVTEDVLLQGFENGIEYAEKAIELDSTSFMAYFYRAANMGRWGETKGLLASLSRAKVMLGDLGSAVSYKSDHGDSWYVLGMIYAEVPKWPVGFGNMEFAVSLSRKSLEHQDDSPDYSYYIELAYNLISRDWSMKKRNREIFNMKKNFDREIDIPVKYCYYEGDIGLNRTEIYSTDELQTLSDEEEAEKIMYWILNRIKSQTEISEYDLYYIEEAEEILLEL